MGAPAQGVPPVNPAPSAVAPVPTDQSSNLNWLVAAVNVLDAAGGQLQSTGTAALQSRVSSEVGAAVAGIISEHWSRAIKELQIEFDRGSAHNLTLQVALASAHTEVAASKADSMKLAESNKRRRIHFEKGEKIVRAAQGQIDAIGTECLRLQTELEQANAELGQTRGQGDQTRAQLGAAHTRLNAAATQIYDDWNMKTRLAEKLSEAGVNQERMNMETQSLRMDVATWTTTAEDAARRLVAAMTAGQSLQSQLTAAVTQGDAQAEVIARVTSALVTARAES